MDHGLDRRLHRRVSLHGAVHGTVGLSGGVRIVDLSLAGAMVEHGHPLSPGQPCVLDLQLEDVQVHVRAHVAWCQVYSVSNDPHGEEEVRYRSGLRFADLPPDLESQLRQHLTTLNPPASPPSHGVP